jgi:hypothetical protein
MHEGDRTGGLFVPTERGTMRRLTRLCSLDALMHRTTHTAHLLDALTLSLRPKTAQTTLQNLRRIAACSTRQGTQESAPDRRGA